MGKDQTVPYGTDFRLDLFQAINCLASAPWKRTSPQVKDLPC